MTKFTDEEGLVKALRGLQNSMPAPVRRWADLRQDQIPEVFGRGGDTARLMWGILACMEGFEKRTGAPLDEDTLDTLKTLVWTVGVASGVFDYLLEGAACSPAWVEELLRQEGLS